MLGDDPTVEPVKQARRAQSLQRRARLSLRQQEQAAVSLAEAVLRVLRPDDECVAAYASFGTEPGTALLRAALRGRTEVLLPVLLPDGDLDWARDGGQLVPGPGGLAVPAGPRLGTDAVAGCTLLVVPALSVDLAGTRLGRGGGAYDRALARASGRVLAALHEGELVPELPSEPHDRPVHGVVLPDRGVVWLDDDPPSGAGGAPAGMSG